MKKKLLVLLITVAVVICSLGGLSAFADVSLEECDKCFQATMNSLLDSEDVDGNTISAIRKPVYDVSLEQLGYVYEFEIASGDGYAVIICDDGNYVAIEVMPHSLSPYADVGEDEQCVYVNSMSYFKAVDGNICEISTGEQITAEALDLLKLNAVFYKNSGITDPEYETVRVWYQSIPAEDMYKMSYLTPKYCGTGLTGGCAAIAGGNIIGFFDRYYEDLIPDHEAGYYESGYYLYNYVDNYVQQAIRTLYSDMEGTDNGITESNFKSGLQKYCSRKGLSCDFSSLMNSGKLNYATVKSSMKSNKPVALFLNTYNTCDIQFYDDYDKLAYTKYFGNHVMVGFGYRDTTYTLTNGNQSNYRFIYVATGFVNPTDAYFNIDYSTNIISSYSVNVH